MVFTNGNTDLTKADIHMTLAHPVVLLRTPPSRVATLTWVQGHYSVRPTLVRFCEKETEEKYIHLSMKVVHVVKAIRIIPVLSRPGH